MKILIIEPYTDGHRAVYAARLVRGALDRDHEVVFATLDSSRIHSEYQALLNSDIERLRFVFIEDKVSSWAKSTTVLSEWAHWLLYRKIAREVEANHHEIDAILVCYLDYCMHMMALLGSPFGDIPFSGIVMKAKFHHQRAGVNTPAFGFNGIKESLFGRLLKNRRLIAIYTIDETLANAYASGPVSGGSKVVYIHDPSDMEIAGPHCNKSELSPILEMPARGPVVLVYGWLNKRKGIQHLIPVMLDLLEREVNITVLLVGRQDEYVRGLLSESRISPLKERGFIRILDRFVNSTEEYQVFDYSDIVWLGYESFYVMSGVMVQAGRMGKPVLVTDEGLVSWMTQKNQAGLVMRLSDRHSIAACIGRLVTDEALREELGENAMTAYSEHSLENFLAGIFENLEQGIARVNQRDLR